MPRSYDANVSKSVDASGNQGVFFSSVPSVTQTRDTKTFSTAAPTTSAAQILATNTARLLAFIYNNGSQTVYLGKDSSVSSSTGIPLLAGRELSDGDSSDAWFAIAASGTGDLRIYVVATS